MAESFYFNIVEKVLEKLESSEISSVWGVKDDLKKLQGILSSVKAVLLDAEEKQVQNHQLRDWLQKVTDACYDAEDVLDEFEVDALGRQLRNQQSIGKKVRALVSSSNPLAFRFKMAGKIKEIREKFDKIVAIKAKFHLIERDDNRHVVNREREMTNSFVRASDVIGRDKDREEIIKLLVDESSDGENVSVIPIVGIGGLGKTALAKLVYNDERVDMHFELKMWVCVSVDFSLKQLVLKIIKSATNQKLEVDQSQKILQQNLREWKYLLTLDVDQLQKVLRDILNGKRYLLIMDDVWSEDPRAWEELKSLFPKAANRSKILVTTRSNRVASVMGTMRGVNGYKLEGLSDNSCLSLLFKCAFKEGQEKQHPHLMKIGGEIVKKCGGIPLAVKTLGSLLYSSTDEHDWVYVRDSEIWNLEQKEDDILPALRLSYDQLPPHLKHCFAYCSIFPKDNQFDNYELIYFWMAHGLLQSPSGNQDLENIGMQYLKKLVSRSFFQDFELDYGNIYSFKMHDLMHDLATSLMKNEFLMVNSDSQIVSRTVRHLSFLNSDALEKDLPTFLSKLGHVRTSSFEISGKGPSQSFLESCISRFRFLWMLRLQNCDIEILPKQIGDLKHLRYLDLSQCRRIKKLPNSICNLHSLQTLTIVKCEELQELPRDIRYLSNLRLLGLTTKQKCLEDNGIGCLSSLRLLVICECENLEYLFEDIGNLKVLRTLLINDCPRLISLPCDIKYLSSLENLVLNECESLDLNLSLGSEGKDDNEALKASTGSHLQILWIKKLPKLVELPQWLLQDTLRTMHIEDCPNFKGLPESLEDLESLQVLHIMDCPNLSSLPKDMNLLTALRELKIEDCPNFMGLPESLQNLESLQVLHIMDCPNLSSLPEDMNLLTALRELKIEDCLSLSQRCIPEIGEDWCKIAHIPNIEIEGVIIESRSN